MIEGSIIFGHKDSPEFLRGLKTVVVRNGEDAEEALATSEIVVADGGVILLAGRV